MAKGKGAAPRKQTDGMSILAAMLVGGVLTVAIGFFLYLWNPFNKVKTSATDTPTVQAKTQTTPASSPKKSNYEFYDLLPEQKITGVPNQAIGEPSVNAINPNVTPDVVVNGKATSNATGSKKPASAPKGTDPATDTVKTVNNPFSDKDKAGKNASNPTNHTADKAADDGIVQRTYILQINSYDNAEQADKRRAQVLMAGVDAQIVKNRLQNGIVLYQVISRPMTSQQAVAEAQSRLQDNGIDSLIVEQRRKEP